MGDVSERPLHDAPALDNVPSAVVLLCGDQRASVESIAKLLADDSANSEVVGIAIDAVEAERMAGEFRPDIVLIDVRVSEFDCIEATQRIRSISPTTRVVILTDRDEKVDPGRDRWRARLPCQGLCPTRAAHRGAIGRTRRHLREPVAHRETRCRRAAGESPVSGTRATRTHPVRALTHWQ